MLLRQMSHALRAALFAVLLLVVACQTAPVQEMSDARQAISVAREAGGPEHAPEEFNAAMEFLKRAESHLDVRRYDDARLAAEQAKQKALDALQRSERASENQQ